MTRFLLDSGASIQALDNQQRMPLHYAADHFGFDYSQCLMVGDSSNDVRAARAAGFGVVCVPYGYNHGRDIREANPDLVVDNLPELAKLFS